MKINPIDVQTFVKNAEYPATKRELIEQAMENGAPKVVVSALERLSEKAYETPEDVALQVAKDPENPSSSDEEGETEPNPLAEEDDDDATDDDSETVEEEDTSMMQKELVRVR